MPINTDLKKPDRPPESRSEQQQKYLAGVVYDLIANSGLENLTMRQVAEAAQVSLGTITYHFRSKQSLISAALESGYGLPEDWDQYRGSPLEQLRRIALSYAFQSPNSRWWRFWVNHLALSTRDPELQANQTGRFDKQRRFWIKLVEEGQAKGEICRGLSPEDAVDQMLVEVHGHVILQMVNPSAKTRSAARSAINQMIDRLLPAADAASEMVVNQRP